MLFRETKFMRCHFMLAVKANMRITGCTLAWLVTVITTTVPVCGQSPDPAESLFGVRNVLDVHLQFTAAEWKKLQPADDVNWDFGDAIQGIIKDSTAGRNFHSEKSSRPGLAGYMGVDHQYGMADVTIGDQTLREVGVRYKGNGTFMGARGSRKFSFKIDFNEYHDDQEFRGLKKINLNNCVTDPSMLREALSYELFREAGVPASRTGWAKVYLTDGGQADHKYMGLYLVVEQVDKRFLKRVFGSSKGLLVKPSTFGAFRYFRDDVAKYEAAYFPKTDPTPGQWQRLIAFARLIHEADDDAFDSEISEFLDMDAFLSFLAMNVILSNLDSFLGGSQNYYAYLDPTSNKFQLLPWDLDISFGAFEMLGTPDARRDLSIDRPQVGQGSNRLVERVLSIPRYKQAHRDRIEQLMESLFAEKKMINQIEDAAEFVGPLVALEGKTARAEFQKALADKPQPPRAHAVKYFVRTRRASLLKQLAGRSEGQHLAWENPEEIIAWIGVGIGFLVAGALNATAWIWAGFAGFRDSNTWGVLNLCFYPIAPMIYGFRKRSDLGRGAAILVLCSSLLMIAVFVVIGLLASSS